MKTFSTRHIGPKDNDLQEMLEVVGVTSLDELIDLTIPASIRLKKHLDLDEPMCEQSFLTHMKSMAKKNKVFRSFIGMGYNNTTTPSVIIRNVFENPGWYTSYTPYQAEISQGRLEALLNYQTMVSDLTAMPIANCSLLDEGTTAAEAMIMFYHTRSRQQVKNGANKFFVSKTCYPQTLDVLKGKSKGLSIELEIGDYNTINFTPEYFGAIIQYPDGDGAVIDYRSFINNAHESEVPVAVATDLLALTLITPPGEWGADCVFGNSQRMGIPMGCGGPHAAFFACTEKFKRSIPGRIIGVSKDRLNNVAYRMALQTREQHIKRDKATSNICTAQALLAVMAGLYACYQGPKRIRKLAQDISKSAAVIAQSLKNVGLRIKNDNFFDTIVILMEENSVKTLKAKALENEINFRYLDSQTVGITFDELVTEKDEDDILRIFSEVIGKKILKAHAQAAIPKLLERSSSFLTHKVFNSYHSETEMMRYIKKLENKDISLVHSMIPLGSCTMKLNAASELIPLSWPEFANIHPFAPSDQKDGYNYILSKLKSDLCEITGFKGVTLQPNSGATGEYAGLMVIKAYHEHRGENNRKVVLIPSSAHGTNPASAVMAGLDVLVVACDDDGNIDIDDVREKAEANRDVLAGFMVTYPSTHGVFEESILKINEIVHNNGGLVYMDGANMNAQVGLTNPGNINADVCHLNLHKTFAIPHGGGGPGVGPIGVAEHLVPFLPQHLFDENKNKLGIHAITSAQNGSALVALISYAYIHLLGEKGLSLATKYAILNANYLKNRLGAHYPVLYTGTNNTVAHELILDCHEIKKNTGIGAGDIAKRLMDYGFHAPTVSFPVHETLMIEPTESEPKAELDRFCEAMIRIRKEIDDVEKGLADKSDNLIMNAPHTAVEATADIWEHSYSRQDAVYPVSYVKEAKYWPPLAKVNDAFGDRNLQCLCPDMESYISELESQK